MSTVSTADLAVRLAVAAVAIGGPTVLHLGLWRFLAWLRDDALIDRLAARGAVEEPRPPAVDVLASATAGVDGRRCPACGSPVIAGATRCRGCQRGVERGAGRRGAESSGADPDDGAVGTGGDDGDRENSDRRLDRREPPEQR
ncbi:hypothetical protein [Halorubrum sp. Boch-26]|uniref:hypothetical protein n=1 Tax=Halorubrum sp. Boch-26 TaxID=2994426 RepID=UPI0024693FD0|nr:hypothetical protein [Halorubrum sp. Boch-26]